MSLALRRRLIQIFNTKMERKKKNHVVSKVTYIESHNNTGGVLFGKLYGRTKITMHVVI